ncbi:filamentous hemagglutinin N-terminal domain-containing protein [Argonema antarcticum]|uniref:two-partner secretion domain-containing protein n=1 Tax=Argonema antarcticum TaxID=2942763 RepID=UPI0020137B5E|nr:S-layer family protein [Argonema antarcticum]MCL1470316.1 S-layer family protein [Argonema antarcticum A004/B2]
MNQLNLKLYLATTLWCLWLFYPNTTTAQIVPDATLPNNSIAIPNGNSIHIEGGTTSGSNLFHSFQEFSVPTGTEAFFNNTLDIQNIFSRITGKNLSNIDGLIRANGTANLFLINPNGIIFGQNAQLNIGGSFIGSTANSIRFGDGSEFSATNPTAPSLLTINVPIGLQFGSNPGSIVNLSTVTGQVNTPASIPISNHVGLAVGSGQTLALVGGNIQLNGGNLTASNGQIILVSVASPSLVSFAPNSFGMNLNYDNISKFGNIKIFNGATINTSGLGGGKVDIRGGNVTLSGSQIYALNLGNIDGRGIDIGAQQFRAEAGAQISTLALGNGVGGDINIRATDSVELSGIGFETYQQFVSNYTVSGTINPFSPQILLISSTAGSSSAGDITIETGRLLIDNGTLMGSATLGIGNAGNIRIHARVLDLAGSGLNTGTLAGSKGTGGSFTFEGEQLIVRDGAGLISSTRSEAPSGNINIKASESVEILRTPSRNPVATLIGTTAVGQNGKAGDINIDTKRLIISEGAGISLSSGSVVGDQRLNTTGGPGGNLTIRATESVEVEGISEVLANGSRNPSFISADANTPSRGGSMQIFTPVLTLRNGGIISTASLGAGDAGNITIDGDFLEVIGNEGRDAFNSQIQVSVGISSRVINPNATANAGSLNLNVSRLILRNGGTVNLQALGTGRAGNINAIADSIALDNKSSIDGTTASGTGANIDLQARSIQLRHNSRIGTDAGSSTGGNININTDTLAALENSDITANAVKGSGGRVSITAQGIFGTQFRESLTPQSDITATSDLGPQFSGTVQINTPNVDPASGLVELSVNFTDFSNLVARSCAAAKGNSLRVTGRGGLPTPPSQPLTGSAVWVDLRSVGQQRDSGLQGIQAENFPFPNQRSPTIEATGWKINQNGQVELVANEKGADGSPWYSTPNCGV